jgi:hypothetical protein
MLTSLSLLLVVPFAIAQTPPLPAKGENGEMGGIFGMGSVKLAGALSGLGAGGFPNGPEFPKPGPRLTSMWYDAHVGVKIY